MAGLIVSSAAVAQQHLAAVPVGAAPYVATVRPAVSGETARPYVEPGEGGSGPAETASAGAPLVPVHADILVSPADGLIGQLFVAMGEHVQPGQTLATVLSNESHALLAHLTFDLEHARQETREIARSVDALDSDLV